jgi:hypothetical protein
LVVGTVLGILAHFQKAVETPDSTAYIVSQRHGVANNRRDNAIFSDEAISLVASNRNEFEKLLSGKPKSFSCKETIYARLKSLAI